MDTISANGLTFAYLAEGSGPLVLLLHGFPDTAHSWNYALPALAKAGYRAVAPFMRGYHPTEIPADRAYDIETLGRDVVALIPALGAERAIVVGHDWGAVAAYSAATAAPERVSLLVTIGIPHPGGTTPTPRIAWAMRHALALRGARGPARIRANNFAYVDELVQRWSPAWKDIPRSETEHVKAAFAHPGSAEAACAYYSALRPYVPRSLRARIRVPTVAFAGEHDLIAPRVYEKARHRFESSYEVVIVPGGHFMHREHPEHVTREIVRTIREHVPNTTA